MDSMLLDAMKGIKPLLLEREIFPNVSSKDIDIVMTDLSMLEINRGCGPRPCQMCCWSAPRSTGEVIPFSVIKQLHRSRPQKMFYSPISYYYQSDSLYYKDGEKDFGDVAQDTIESGMSLRVITHGWLIGEEIPERAMTKLIELAKEPTTYRRMRFAFSIDNLGWIGIPSEIHRESVKHILQMLLQLEGDAVLDINAFYNPNDFSGPGSSHATEEFIALVVPEELKPLVNFCRLQAVGRAKKINPTPPEVSETSSINYLNFPGCLIRSNGDIIYMSPSKHFPERRLNVGNIFTGLNEHFYNRILPVRNIIEFAF